MLQPDYFSFHVNSFNREDSLFLNDPGAVKELITEAKKQGVKPEFEMLDLGVVYKAIDLIKEFELGTDQRFQFMFGINGGVSDFNNRALQAFIEAVGPDHHWGVGAVGRFQLRANLAAMMDGGDVRVGFEDNIYIRKGQKAENNAQFVERVVDLARDINVDIATVEEARKKLNCQQQIA